MENQNSSTWIGELLHYLHLLIKHKYISEDRHREISDLLRAIDKPFKVITTATEDIREAIDEFLPGTPISLSSQSFSSDPGTPPMLPEPIRHVEDKNVILAYIREANGIDANIDMKTIMYNKIKYYFDNVYTKKFNYDDIIENIYNFVNERKLLKDTSILLYGYSGSGKSTLTNNLLKRDFGKCSYIIKSIYLNATFIYNSTLKKMDEYNGNYDCNYKFNATLPELQKILLKMTTISDNGCNKTSSRSHTCITICNENGTKINLIDLCGNERVAKKSSFFAKADIIQKETIFINKSLYNVSAYIKNKKHKDNKCQTLKLLNGCNNIAFVLLLNDAVYDEMRLPASNHLSIFRDILLKKK